jgi:hypothetical protein
MPRSVFSASGASRKSTRSTSKCTAKPSQAESGESAARALPADQMRCSARRRRAAYDKITSASKVCVRPEPEEADLSGAQHWSVTGERGEPVDGAVDVEHVRHAHPVQGAVDRAVGHVEVSVPIDVDDTQPLDTMQKAGHGADTDRAVASEDHNRVLAWSGSDQRSDLAGTVDDRAGVRCPGFSGSGRHRKGLTCPPRRTATAGRLQPLDQAGLEQRAGTILLTGRVAARARRGLYDHA